MKKAPGVIIDHRAGYSKKVATVLQLLKETGRCIGEAWQIKWIDVDVERETVECKPEKNSNPRMFKVSSKLIAMLDRLPKDSEYVFRKTNLLSFRSNYFGQRKRIASKLDNPRLLNVHFHTLRHWKATMEYHKTKDILHVKALFGHKKIDNTLIYTQLIGFDNEDDLTCKTAKAVEEAKGLIEVGFEFVTDFDGVKLFRKRR